MPAPRARRSPLDRARFVCLVVALALLAACTREAPRAPSLAETIASGDLAALERLLAEGVDLEARDSAGLTPLVLAAQDGSADVVALLLAHGADVSATVADGWTPLHAAAARGQHRRGRGLVGARRPGGCDDGRRLHAALPGGPGRT